MGIFLLCCIAVIIIFIIFHKVAFEFYTTAISKGYDDIKYYWWTLLMTPIGIAMVIALPDKNNFDRLIKTVGISISNKNTMKKETIDELPEL